MKSSFPSHFANDKEQIKTLWAECLFVFDTNVLTGLYKYSDETRDALYQVIESLGDRLWIPYQVIFEYLDNRAKIVNDQAKLYAGAINNLENFKSDLEAQHQHPFVSKEVYDNFCKSAKDVFEELSSRKNTHEARITDDDIKTKLSDLLEGRVGPKYSPEQLESIAKEGAIRYSQKIPPGFQDRDKHKDSVLTKEINKRYGDFIFWKQILEKSKESASSIILVTSERKEDWWSLCAGKIIGPLPELIDEFHNITGKSFYLYSTHNFLDLANDFLQQHTSSAAVDEVRDTFIEERKRLDLESDITQSESLLTDTSRSRKLDTAHYQQQERLIEIELKNTEEILKNLKIKLKEAESISSPAVVHIYMERLKVSLRRRKSLRIKLRYYNRRLNEFLRDELI